MRILITCDPFIPVPPRTYGGIERIVDGLVRGLRALGHQVGLVAHPDSESGANTFYPWWSPGVSAIDHVRNLAALRRAIHDFAPEVLHSYSRLAYLLPALATRQPVIMSYQREISVRNARAARWLFADRISFTACSQRLADKGSIAGGRWHGIPNFVDVGRFPFAAEVAKDAPLLFLSRLDRVKGADRAIKLALQAGIPLILAGNRAEAGPERDYFEQEIAPHVDGQRVRWVGPVDDAQKCYWLCQARALLVPIRWEEPFGIVFAEALACGTPVISTPRGALPEIVENGVHGYLAEEDAALLSAIGHVHTLNRHACRERAERHFAQDIVVQQYESLYRTLTRTTEAKAR